MDIKISPKVSVIGFGLLHPEWLETIAPDRQIIGINNSHAQYGYAPSLIIALDDLQRDEETHPQYVKEIVDVWRLAEGTTVGTSNEKWVPMVYNREDEESTFTDIPVTGIPWSYWLNTDVLVVPSAEAETLKVRYRRGCTDEEGYPLIFDSQNLQEAMMWYIISRMFMRKFTHPVLNFQLAMEEYKRYFRQARSELKFPTEGEMEELLRSWVGISYEETDYKLYSSADAGNRIYPGYGYVEYGTGNVTPALEDPLPTGSGAIT